jgi:predicted nucleic-acid-binding Zn-ribbon protein
MGDDYSWQCNACGSDEFTSSVSEDSFDNDGMSCTNCGGTEFHKVPSPPSAEKG